MRQSYFAFLHNSTNHRQKTIKKQFFINRILYLRCDFFNGLWFNKNFESKHFFSLSRICVNIDDSILKEVFPIGIKHNINCSEMTWHNLFIRKCNRSTWAFCLWRIQFQRNFSLVFDFIAKFQLSSFRAFGKPNGFVFRWKNRHLSEDQGGF